MRARSLLLATALLALVAFVVAPLLPSTHGVAAAAEPDPSAFEQAGLRVEMRASALRGADAPLLSGDDLELAFTVREARANGRALTGLTPLAWLLRRAEGEGLPDRAQCKRTIQGLLAGRLATASAVDLNRYYAVTLDDNNSLSIVDPQLDSSRTKTIGMVQLVGRGADFALAADRRTVLVTLPEVGRLAAADIDRRLARTLDLGGQPANLALAPDGAQVWVGQETEAWVDVVQLEPLEHVRRIALSSAPHEIVFRADSGTAYVFGALGGKVCAIDGSSLEVVGALEAGGDLAGIALSELALRLYLGRRDGRVLAVDLDTFQPAGTLELGPGLTHLAVTPDGRHGLALFRERDELRAFDTATCRASEPVATSRAPERLEFTTDFGYVSHSSSEQALLVDLGVLSQEDRLAVTSVPMGALPPLQEMGTTLAPLLAPLPEGGGALVLNPADRSLYHFMEGMNAPAGSYPTYPWTARGVLLVDRTLREVADGRYRASFRAPEPGRYTVPFLLPASPQLYGCFALEIGGLPQGGEVWKSLRIELLASDVLAGSPQELRVRLVDVESGEPATGLDDVVVLMTRGPLWHWRGVAQPALDGVYSWSLAFPQPGRYRLFLASATRGLELGALPSAQIEVRPAGAPLGDDTKGPSRNPRP